MSQQTSPAAEFLGVSKSYGSIPALREVSFALKTGETVGLLGRNGAGKTTTLNLLTGYYPPGAGTVRIAGKDMQKDPAFCKRQIGYLPERPPLYDEMTVWEYLCFVCDLRLVTARARRAHVTEIVDRCGLREVRDRLLGNLSKGYRQRVGLAQALCGSPPLLILDEPTVGLDPAQTVEIRQLITALSRDHTVLFSSHLLQEVQQLCGRVLVLAEGRLVGDLAVRGPEASEGGIRLRLRCGAASGDVKTLLSSLPWLAEVREAEETGKGAGKEWILLLAPGVTEEEGEDRLFHVLAEKNWPIRMLVRERDTLEEIFLKLTG